MRVKVRNSVGGRARGEGQGQGLRARVSVRIRIKVRARIASACRHRTDRHIDLLGTLVFLVALGVERDLVTAA